MFLVGKRWNDTLQDASRVHSYGGRDVSIPAVDVVVTETITMLHREKIRSFSSTAIGTTFGLTRDAVAVNVKLSDRIPIKDNVTGLTKSAAWMFVCFAISRTNSCIHLLCASNCPNETIISSVATQDVTFLLSYFDATIHVYRRLLAFKSPASTGRRS